jgi:hypothetical protein
MIEQSKNVYKDKFLRRIVETDPELRQITLHDSRYYQRSPGVFYPSVTTILSFFPKGAFFETWLKDVGHNSDIVMRRAGDEGTQVHEAIESFLKGEEIRWIESNGKVNYATHVWKMILGFVDFWTTYKPTLLLSEEFMYSDTYKYSGTLDLLVDIKGEKWLLDIKTSNNIHDSYYLQMSAYTKAYEERYLQKVDHNGIIWLKSTKRGPDKTGKKMQGAGWEILEGKKTVDEYFQMFLHTYETYKIMHPETEIELLTLPNTVKLGQ